MRFTNQVMGIIAVILVVIAILLAVDLTGLNDPSPAGGVERAVGE